MTELNFRSDMKVELIDKMGSDQTVARAAKVSTGNDELSDGKINGLIRHLIQADPPHSSTYEHAIMTIRMNVPIFVHRQLMTHRTLSKNSESGRYTEFKPDFYIPEPGRPLANIGTSARPNLVDHADEKITEREIARHIQTAEHAWKLYQESLADGVAKEIARDHLPVTSYTSIWMTGNLLAWFNFLTLRNGDKGHPQKEIVDCARQVEEILAENFPIVYNAWKTKA
jgi:thymidylate synthase (FAD)